MFSWKWKKKKVNEEAIEIKESLPISCIAQAILDDLDNLADWDYQPDASLSYLTNTKRQYALAVSSSLSMSNYVSLCGIYGFKFNDTESNLILKKGHEIIKQKQALQATIDKQSGMEKLKQLFPECFKEGAA